MAAKRVRLRALAESGARASIRAFDHGHVEIARSAATRERTNRLFAARFR